MRGGEDNVPASESESRFSHVKERGGDEVSEKCYVNVPGCERTSWSKSQGYKQVDKEERAEIECGGPTRKKQRQSRETDDRKKRGWDRRSR